MALDRHKSLEAAERLLKQGKVQAALAQLEKVAAAAPHDPVTLNRMGDLLAREGRRSEAVGYYHQIAKHFASQGFYPKAVAIYKKILRVDPNNGGALIELGELYLKQKLPGEARRYLLRSAELYVQTRDFATARSVYERLVAAEPRDARHRARLAEARAAEGDVEKAAEELVLLGRTLLDGQKAGDAEKAFRRAAELAPGIDGPIMGVAACMSASGREEEALAFLEQQSGSGECSAEILGAILCSYERAGRPDDALAIMRREGAQAIPASRFREIVAAALENGTADRWWERVTPVFDDWSAQGHGDELASILDELTELEVNGHLPALRSHYRVMVAAGDRAALIASLERLIRACQTRALEDEVPSLLDELRKVAPHSPLLGQPVPADPAPPAAGGTTPPPASAEPPRAVEPVREVAPVPVEVESAAPAAVPVQAEAPAVPLNKGDEEFVSGRLTQADILEKYGLREQALQQIREVADRFPGHLPAQQRLVGLLRDGSESHELRDALVALALARRAAGESAEARESAREALRLGALDEATVRLLERLDLVPSATSAPSPPAQVVAPPARPPASREEAVPVAATPADDEDVVLIDFDAMDEDAPDVAEVAAAPEGDAAIPPPDAVPVDDPATSAPPPEASFGGLDEDDDLSAITAALESELFAEEAGPAAAEAESEQSLEDVFAAFKKHVSEEIAQEDYRTHYDLGIGYKEMGLVDEAIAEFQIVIGSGELRREACAMLAACHRERQDVDQAIGWYRQAIDSPGNDDQAKRGLRYELAEVLLQSGAREEALSLYRDVMQADPSYRDVQSRIDELKSSLS